MAITEQPLHSGVIALDQIASPLLVDVPDTVEMWIVAMIDLADHSPI